MSRHDSGSYSGETPGMTWVVTQVKIWVAHLGTTRVVTRVRFQVMTRVRNRAQSRVNNPGKRLGKNSDKEVG
jgi:hypothetical protein